MAEYTYTKSPCAVNRLKKEIDESAIVTALDFINLFGDQLSINFKATLSGGDETILNAIVTAHTGEPLLEDVAQLVTVQEKDPDTGMLATTPKWAPAGWTQRYHEVEFKTSQLNSIHDKNFDGADTGFSSIKFYDEDDVELTTQGAIDTDCVKTVYDFMPNHDYAIKAGMIAQIEAPASPVYLWAVGAPGIADVVFCQGGINLEFVAPKTLIGLDGTASTLMYYEHPLLGAGAGTNKIRFIVRHTAGFKHRIQAIFEYFSE